MSKQQFHQEPVAIVGLACRLPGGNHNPQKLWDFLERGGVSSNEVPESRFNIAGHYNGSHKPGTMRPRGGMFLGDVDLRDFDAGFFEIGGTEAIAMDPNQRQMLEVVVEGLENAGLTLEDLDGARVACFVGSYASDYGDMQNRDAEDRPANCAIGVGRSIMANRISYFLNIKGPSITIDTACSGSLVGLDLACRSVQSGEVDAAIVATSNLYLNPDHVMDAGNVGQAHSPTALCHTFDVDADGYVKAEAVSCIIVKRLSLAISDRDPIRAIVRGTASNSNGRTGGIASPSAEAQAAAIRAAYANAGISNFNETAYLECHGTGTQAGDPTEVRGVGSVFAASRQAEQPLLIGSIKSNIGHSEPAAGNSGLLKVILSMEKGVIPGTPLFIKPNPKIDFNGFKVKASRSALAWPDQGFPLRRASINSFGYGGSNAHAILEQPGIEVRRFFTSSYVSEAEDATTSERPYLVVVSANDALSLKHNIQALSNHLVNPRVGVDLADLAYTLSERRTRLWHRGFLTTRTTEEVEEDGFTVGKNAGQPPKIAFVFTGQGAQWPQMGKQMLEFFPWTRAILEELDAVLQAQADPPSWSLVRELTESRTPDHLRQPEFSQPLVTALQLCILAVLESWGITASSAVGHSSGEIAAAYTAGLLDRAGAIKAAFYRGRAAVNRRGDVESDVGMLAVGLGPEAVSPFLEKYAGDCWIACFNSHSSVTISGRKPALEALSDDVKAAGHFARLLQVDLAYHSKFMDLIGDEYETLLTGDGDFRSTPATDTASGHAKMFSSVTASEKTTASDASYWKDNMVSPVRFAEALTQLVEQDAPTFIIEVGPSGALAGPVSQTLKKIPRGADVGYCAAWSRGAQAGKSLFDVAGRLFVTGAPIDLALVNGYDRAAVRTIVDLPNYKWNHTVKYWHENAASRDWRFKKFITHDLLGSKIPGTTWESPTWRKHLNLADVPWLRDHKMGPDVLVPGAGLVTLAVEAIYQKHCVLNPDEAVSAPNELAYRIRNVKFERAVVVEENKPTTILVTLSRVPGSKDWHEFRIRTAAGEGEGVVYEHCAGLIRVQPPIGDEEALQGANLAPLRHPQSAKLWYKAQFEVGMGFGPAFQKIKSIESVSGSRKCRTIVSLEPPPSKWAPQSYYPLHPAVLDGCLQTATPANAAGERSLIKDTMIPALVDDVVINKMPAGLVEGLSVAESVYTGRGRPDVAKSWTANVAIHDPQTGALLLRVKGLNYIRLDVEEKPDPHVFLSVTWKPDISLLTQDQLLYLSPHDQIRGRVDTVIDLIAAKTPSLRVLELNLDESDTSTVWLREDSEDAKVAYAAYDFASTSAKSLVGVQSVHEARRDTSFLLADPEKPNLGLDATAGTYDLIIIKATEESKVPVELAASGLKGLLKKSAFVLVLPVSEAAMELPTTDGIDPAASSPPLPARRSSTSSGSSSLTEGSTPPGAESLVASVAASSRSSAIDLEVLYDKLSHSPRRSKLGQAAEAASFSSVMEIPGTAGGASPSYLCRYEADEEQHQEPRLVHIARFDDNAPGLPPALRASLEASGWTIASSAPVERVAATNAPAGSAILVLDELFKPVLTTITEAKWEALKKVVCSGTPLLWVTKGAQTGQVTEPDNAMVQGLFRVARNENPQARLATLDVQSATSPATGQAIDKVLRKLRAGSGAGAETEYAERDGVLLLQRIRPDEPLNRFKAAEDGKSTELVARDLHANEAQIRLQATKIGTLDSLTWCETAVHEVDMEPGMVEIEVMAVGVNFKDVATTMGIVPENEYTIGCECAGFIKRIAPGLNTHFKVGDRVAAMRSGTYVNRVQCPHERVHIIPDSMTFEEAATIPLVYLTAIYSLYHLGNLKEGQSVLIHSAAGGVGIAAIQLAQHKKCDIFVTVGTDDKRAFLAREFKIPENRMFSSRNPGFADEIRRATAGRGVDVILNSLVGELLDESWRLTADGGVMVEIGKRDIVDRNTLAMEPFDRNCSFRAVDLSYTREISNGLIGRLLDEIFDLVRAGHVGPVRPITTYGFDKVIPALSYMRRGQHIGKIVVSSGGAAEDNVRVPVRPAVARLRLDPEAVYVIVGGLRGLCGSLAVHMARHGARHITVVSRSGTYDEASSRVIQNCAAWDCTVVGAKGDVGDLAFVEQVFKNARPRRVAGVIQGAMVLRDKPFENMSHEDYHAAIHAKVTGTWNLHHAAQNRAAASPLDFFTLLSSISGVVGNKGQANYAAANAFLDAFAHYRLARGQPAHVVDLGAIQDVGYVAEQGGAALEARFDKQQWTPVNEAMARRILTYSILQQSPHHHPISPRSRAQLVTGLAFPLVATADGSGLAEDPRFGYLYTGGASQAAGDGDDATGANDQTAQALKAFGVLRGSGADPIALARAALTLLQAQVTRILRLETEMEAGKPLMAYGLDSLSAVELRGWVRQRMGAELSTLDITNASSLVALSEKLVSKLPEPGKDV